MLGSIKMTLGWKCKYFWISEYSDQIVPILLQRKICIEIISETKRNPVISPRTQKFAQPLVKKSRAGLKQKYWTGLPLSVCGTQVYFEYSTSSSYEQESRISRNLEKYWLRSLPLARKNWIFILFLFSIFKIFRQQISFFSRFARFLNQFSFSSWFSRL